MNMLTQKNSEKKGGAPALRILFILLTVSYALLSLWLFFICLKDHVNLSGLLESPLSIMTFLWTGLSALLIHTGLEPFLYGHEKRWLYSFDGLTLLSALACLLFANESFLGSLHTLFAGAAVFFLLWIAFDLNMKKRIPVVSYTILGSFGISLVICALCGSITGSAEMITLGLPALVLALSRWLQR